MKNKPDPLTCSFGARQIETYLTAFNREIEGARAAEDIEPIHQLRVYSRRLRSTLPLFKACLPRKSSDRWIKQIKKITASLGLARDTDVQIEFLKNFRQSLPEKKFEAGIDRLILRLSQKREKLQRKVVKSLDKLEDSGTIPEIKEFLQTRFPEKQEEDHEPAAYPLNLYHLAYEALLRTWESFISYEEIIPLREKVKELHEMRIAAKSLRYTIEVFAPIYKSKLKAPYLAIRASQEMLGRIHDLDIWGENIPKFIESESKKTLAFYGTTSPLNFLLPGLSYFEEHLKDQREQVYLSFLQSWQQWKENGVWIEFMDSIRMPSYPRDALSASSPTNETSD
jgi:CHAD domain-containing protein